MKSKLNLMIKSICYLIFFFRMAEFLGYSPEDLIGKSVYEFQHALDAPAVDKPFKTRKNYTQLIKID